MLTPDISSYLRQDLSLLLSSLDVTIIKLDTRVLKMATRRITQETFDAVVRENKEEFGMEPDEALSDAVEQFESQGKIA